MIIVKVRCKWTYFYGKFQERRDFLRITVEDEFSHCNHTGYWYPIKCNPIPHNYDKKKKKFSETDGPLDPGL